MKDDQDLPILREPLMVTDEQQIIFRHLVNGDRKYRLPVILVSKSLDGKLPLDITWLASRVKGAAHVLVEKDLGKSKKIREICNIQDDVYGNILIFYPTGPVREKRITY